MNIYQTKEPSKKAERLIAKCRVIDVVKPCFSLI